MPCRAAAEQIPAVLSDVQSVIAQGFTEEEFAQLKGFLRRILVNAQPFGGEPVPPAAAPSGVPPTVS